MPRHVLWTAVALSTFAALLGLRAGWHYANLTETKVIEAAVADYIAQEKSLGRQPSPTDCSARPGDDGRAWIVVLCMPLSDATTQRTEYVITRFGRMERTQG